MRRASWVAAAALVVLAGGCGGHRAAPDVTPTPSGSVTEYDLGYGLRSRALGQLKLDVLPTTGAAVFPCAYGDTILSFACSPTTPTANAKLVFTCGWNPSSIWTMDADGSRPRCLNVDGGYPALSPDGSKIAYQTNKDGNYEIYVMNADGTGQKRLTNNTADDRRPSFSPDGSRIVFDSTRENADGSRDVWVMCADGTGALRVTYHPGDDTDASFSPDGRTVIYISRCYGNAEVCTSDLVYESGERLTTTTAEEGQPHFSPDGASVVFFSTRDGTDTLYRAKANGTSPVRLIPMGSMRSPSFSPDGTKIAFLFLQEYIILMNADGSGQTAVFDGGIAPLGHTSFAPPRGPRRVLVGAAGADGGYNPPFTSTPSGIIAPLNASRVLAHAVAFYANTAITLSIKPASPAGAASSGTPVGALVTADSIRMVYMDNGMRLPITAIVGTANAMFASPVSGIVLYFDQNTGEVASVFQVKRSRAAGSLGFAPGGPESGPTFEAAGPGRVKLAGAFPLAADVASGRRFANLAEAVVDARGRIASAR